MCLVMTMYIFHICTCSLKFISRLIVSFPFPCFYFCFICFVFVCSGFGLLTLRFPDTLYVFKEHDRKTESLGTKCHGHPKQNNVIRNEFPKGNVIINSFLVHVHVDVYTLSNINLQHISRYKIFSLLVAVLAI